MSCTVYVVRHGPAEGAAAVVSDDERGLTPAGREAISGAALGLKRQGVKPSVVLASPLVRARETAKILASVLAPNVGVEKSSVLAPGGSLSTIVNALGEHPDAGQILLVGHQPTMGELASALLTGWPGLVPLPFKPGAVAAIDLAALPAERQGSLRWFLTADQLRQMGDGREPT